MAVPGCGTGSRTRRLTAHRRTGRRDTARRRDQGQVLRPRPADRGRTACGRPARRRSRSTGSGSPPCRRSAPPARPSSSTSGPWSAVRHRGDGRSRRTCRPGFADDMAGQQCVTPCATTTGFGSLSHRRDSVTLPGAGPRAAQRRTRPPRPRPRPADRSPPTRHHGRRTVIAAIGLLIGIIAGLVLEPDVPAVAASPTCRSPSWPPSTPSSAACAPTRRHLRRPGLRGLVPVATSWSPRRSSTWATSSASAAQLSTGVVVVLGIRIFSNAAAIRRHLLKA